MTPPFEGVPGGVDIARYFWHEIVLADQQGAPYRRGQYHGCDGINLWRDGRDYCYLWVEATVDHDMWMAYLLEIRTNQGGVESRDHLYLAAGGGDLFEVEWRNQPIRFDAPVDDHVDHHRAAMHWFVEREVGTIDDRNGGDQGLIDRADAANRDEEGPALPLPVLCNSCGRALANVGEWCCDRFTTAADVTTA